MVEKKLTEELEKEADQDVELLLLRAFKIAAQIESDLPDVNFLPADVVQIAKLVQIEEQRYSNLSNEPDGTGKWVLTKK